MSSPSAALSQTLHSITTTKVSELKKQQSTHEVKKKDYLDKADEAKDDPEKSISHLVEGVKALDPRAVSETQLTNILRWTAQSCYDPTISKPTLEAFGDQLRKRLDVQTRRLEFASLYSGLLTGWLSKPTMIDEEAPMDDGSSVESYEILERDRLKDLREKFEDVVFNAHPTDEIEIDNYLRALFSGEKGEIALKRVRSEVKNLAPKMDSHAPFDINQLKWCMKSLLCEELLNDEKKKILRDFLHDDVALNEIADVLNMRWEDIENWQWSVGEHGIPVEPRRQLNGKWRVMMDEDILEAIFIEFIGIKFSIAFKHAFKRVLYSGMWKRSPRMSPEELDRRRYYLGDDSDANYGKNVDELRQNEFRDEFFLCQLPSSIQDISGGYEGDEDDREELGPRKSWVGMRQQLLRKFTTEIMLQKYLKGNVAVVQSDLQWYATALPHSTIFALLRFSGVSEAWIQFFKKFLEAPLNMEPVSDEPNPIVRIRKRGVPISHALEKTFGELVLVFMDFVVNQESDMILYRLHDDLWLCGNPSDCAKAWKAMQNYAHVMGLEFNRKKTGSMYLGGTNDAGGGEIANTLPSGPVTMGFLKLNPKNGRWIIDEDAVDAHTRQLKKQLGGCTSIFAWIQTWNSCIGRFFGHTFGEPANCLGREHIDNVLKTHAKMQKELFQSDENPDRSVIDHVKEMIKAKYGELQIPDGFIFLPQELGGLGLRNPFISLFLVRDNLPKEPKTQIGQFLKEEEEDYKWARTRFENMGTQGRRRHFRTIYTRDDEDGESSVQLPNIDKFLELDEFTRWRERTSSRMARVYESLLGIPREKEIILSERVRRETKFAGDEFSSEHKWLLQLYSEELFDQFGGINIVDKTLLPLGVMTMLKNSKVKWQMVL